ncbi:hypothetical protein NC652_008626 [Populus alba x Populus x berolinensis]|nr:hypothetical protein NC652_008626 [Populus alba x Populus x berolinensis]
MLVLQMFMARMMSQKNVCCQHLYKEGRRMQEQGKLSMLLFCLR